MPRLPPIKGKYFLAFAALCSVISLILQIVIHVGQASTSAGQNIAMVKVNLVELQNDMRAVFGNSSINDDLYNKTQGAPLGQSLGLRQEYRWGIYGYCAYIFNTTTYGQCSNATFASSWTPYETISSDVTPNYYVQVNQFIIQPLRDSPYLGTLSHVSFYLIFVSTVATILVIPLGLLKSTLTFLFAAALSIGAATALLIAASMWTSAISHVQVTNRTRTGIVVTNGEALSLLWAAFAFSLVSVLPYVLSQQTYRRFD